MGYVGMVERRENFGLALESRQPFAILRHVGWQDLEGDLALQGRESYRELRRLDSLNQATAACS